MSLNLFEYPEAISQGGRDVTGFDVHATDGLIGVVAHASYRHGTACVVIDTATWIAGEKRLLPAGVIRGVNWDSRALFIGMRKDEVRNAPKYDEHRYDHDFATYLRSVGPYYEPWAPGLDQVPRNRGMRDTMPL